MAENAEHQRTYYPIELKHSEKIIWNNFWKWKPVSHQHSWDMQHSVENLQKQKQFKPYFEK